MFVLDRSSDMRLVVMPSDPKIHETVIQTKEKTPLSMFVSVELY